MWMSGGWSVQKFENYGEWCIHAFVKLFDKMSKTLIKDEYWIREEGRPAHKIVVIQILQMLAKY
jgi:hypothetical protein